MTSRLPLPTRATIAIALLIASAIATWNAIALRQPDIKLVQSGSHVVIARAAGGESGLPAALQPGDIVLSIGAHPVNTLSEARWFTARIPPHSTVEIRVRRGNTEIAGLLLSNRRMPLDQVAANQAVGLAILLLGLVVWWMSHPDGTVKAFFGLTSVTGLAVLLNGPESAFGGKAVQTILGSAWIVCYALVPALFVDFVSRFQRVNQATTSRWRSAAYVPSLGLAAYLCLSYGLAVWTASGAWILRYTQALRYGLGLLMLGYVALAVGLMIRAAVRSSDPAERNRNRWLALTSAVGVAPFLLLHKLPAMIGGEPLIALHQAMYFLIVAPLGWAMAVASFRLLNLEWTLSRTIIYVVAGGVLLYAVLAPLLLSGEAAGGSLAAWRVTVGIAAAIIVFLAAVTLVRGIRSVVDRAYYGDWFNFRRSVQHLSRELAGAIVESEIARILTVELPQLLRLEKSALAARQPDGSWSVIPETAGHAETVRVIHSLSESPLDAFDRMAFALRADHPLAVRGYEAVLWLRYRDDTLGYVLLGGKSSHAPYSIRDMQLLETLSPFAAVALANLNLHRTLIAQERRAVAADLAGGIAHEIRNALSPLMGQAQLISAQLDAKPESVSIERLTGSAHLIAEMCQRIARIADGLRHISEPLRLEKTAVKLDEVAEDAIRLTAETAGRIKRYAVDDPAAPFQLHRHFDRDLPVIQADAEQICQVFINLILNAADAMEPLGRGTLTVGTAYSADENLACGFVEDSGPGIPRELRDKVFQPYFTTKPKGKGTGLGLAMVRAIVEAHGGRVRLRSSAAGGARFEFFVPTVSSGA